VGTLDGRLRNAINKACRQGDVERLFIDEQILKLLKRESIEQGVYCEEKANSTARSVFDLVVRAFSACRDLHITAMDTITEFFRDYEGECKKVVGFAMDAIKKEYQLDHANQDRTVKLLDLAFEVYRPILLEIGKDDADIIRRLGKKEMAIFLARGGGIEYNNGSFTKIARFLDTMEDVYSFRDLLAADPEIDMSMTKSYLKDVFLAENKPNTKMAEYIPVARLELSMFGRDGQLEKPTFFLDTIGSMSVFLSGMFSVVSFQRAFDSLRMCMSGCITMKNVIKISTRDSDLYEFMQRYQNSERVWDTVDTVEISDLKKIMAETEVEDAKLREALQKEEEDNKKHEGVRIMLANLRIRRQEAKRQIFYARTAIRQGVAYQPQTRERKNNLLEKYNDLKKNKILSAVLNIYVKKIDMFISEKRIKETKMYSKTYNQMMAVVSFIIDKSVTFLQIKNTRGGKGSNSQLGRVLQNTTDELFKELRNRMAQVGLVIKDNKPRNQARVDQFG
jgi:hypothetical protein